MATDKSPARRTGTRSGGPKTASGKSASSLNAIKHGVTTPRLLNHQEEATYNDFVKALREQYKSTNPLVNWQIERTARLRVQLERAQSQMESLHRLSLMKSDTFDLAAKAMGLSEDQTHVAAKYMHWVASNPSPESKTSPIQRRQLRMMLELQNYVDGYQNWLQTYEDFLKFTPIFCEYIVSDANDRKMSLHAYLQSHRPSDPVFSGKEAALTIHVNVDPIHVGHDTVPQWVEAKISDVSIDTLQTSMFWLYDEASTYLQNFFKITPIRSIMHESQALALPPADDLDRLMRYQTTLQRQLSTVMGELLALVERDMRA